MKKVIVLVIVALSAVSCSVINDQPKIEQKELSILGVAQGKMKKVDGEWIIYEEASDMKYEENDTCVYNQEEISCLRHGFIISYDSRGKDVKLNCIAKTNIKVNAGNTAEHKYTDTNEDDFYMPLSGVEKVFINPQYVSAQPGLEDLHISTTCSFKGEEVFGFSQQIRF